MNTSIEGDRYYKLSEVLELSPILKSRGLRFLYDYRARQVPELFVNTSVAGKRPRYFIKGTTLMKLLHDINKMSPVNK